MKKKLKRTGSYFLLVIILWFILAQLFFRYRMSDKTAMLVFKKNHTDLRISDIGTGSNKIHFAVSGNDTLPTLYFLHGSPGSWSHYFKYMLDKDMRKKYRMVGIDRPGFGYSNFWEAADLKRQAGMITPLFKELYNGKPVYLAGHSLGAPLALKLAVDNPSFFHCVVLLSGSIDPDQEQEEKWRKLMGGKPLCYLLPGSFRPSNTEILFLKNDLKALSVVLDKIKTHVVFIHGDKDTWVPIENIAFGKKVMTNAKSIYSDTLHGAGHQIPWERFDEVKKALLNLPY